MMQYRLTIVIWIWHQTNHQHQNYKIPFFKRLNKYYNRNSISRELIRFLGDLSVEL